MEERTTLFNVMYCKWDIWVYFKLLKIQFDWTVDVNMLSLTAKQDTPDSKSSLFYFTEQVERWVLLRLVWMSSFEGICLVKRTVKCANWHLNNQTGRGFQIIVERNRKGMCFISVK